MQDSKVILELKAVTIRSVSSQVCGLLDIDFSLNRGEVALIELEEGREHIPLAALAQGLINPDQGNVFFNGEDWAQMGATRQSQNRGRIRRVFEHYGWISNLDVMENLCLSECYHSSRDFKDVQQEACGLARRFGIDPIPDARPTRVHNMVLRKLEWVRAFIGTPDLIILERPFFGAPKADFPKLIEVVCEAAHRGVSVLWCSDDVRIKGCRELANARWFRMDGENIAVA